MKRKLITLLCWTALCCGAQAQRDSIDVTLEADVISHNLWRGFEFGSASVQPSLGVAWHGLSLSAWGTVGITNAEDPREIDLTLSYTTGGFRIAVTDYWSVEKDTEDKRYFHYDAHETRHLFEASAGYDFGAIKGMIPVSLTWNMMFGGADAYNKKGKRAYSSYIELGVPFRLGGCDWNAKMGIVPYATDYYETNGFAVVETALRATRDINITSGFVLPVFAELVANPHSEKLWFGFGFTIRPFQN